MQILPVPQGGAEFQAVMDEVQRQALQQCGIPQEMLETIQERDGWLRLERSLLKTSNDEG